MSEPTGPPRPPGPLRIVIAEDNYLVREGLRRLLEDSGQVDVLACVGTAIVRRLRAGLIVGGHVILEETAHGETEGAIRARQGGPPVLQRDFRRLLFLTLRGRGGFGRHTFPQTRKFRFQLGDAPLHVGDLRCAIFGGSSRLLRECR